MTGRIIVVDDDVDLRFTLQEILMDEGQDVISAEDGFQAVKMAAESRIALIFMDIQMLGMNGVDAFLAIKEILHDCVVVMMTGYAGEDLIQKALSEGAKTVLSKPVSIQQILEIIDEVAPETILSSGESSRTRPIMSGTKAKIMVADDDPGMLFTVTDILEYAGYVVSGAKDGYEAVEMASQQTFALVFMDIVLPGIDGVEAYRQIKSVKPGTMVITMTGFTVENLISQDLGSGAYTVLYKPYKPLNITSLLMAVKDVLDSPCVLVVDDEPDMQESVKMIFEGLGYQVALASDGYHAVADAASKRYDVILMDIGMPGIDGFEACRRIVDSDPSAKVVFVTAHDVNECARQALVAGAFSLLGKPVEPEDMITLVDSLVGSGHAARGTH